MASARTYFGRVIFVALAAASGMTGCAGSISPGDLLEQIRSGSPPLIIDVRTHREFLEGHVPGAVNISVFDFRSPFERLNPPRDRPIVLICEHGPRASFAGFVLRFSGYEKVLNLDGAMKEWKKNRLPMEY